MAAHVQGQFPTLVLDLLHACVTTILLMKVKAKIVFCIDFLTILLSPPTVF
jgi:hypothetical protein